MLFNSYIFIAFYVVVLVGYSLLRRAPRMQNRLLLVASYYFYASWDARFLSLIVLSTVVDFVAARRIQSAGQDSGSEGHRRRLTWLTISLVINLGVLAIFKYLDFAIESAQRILSAFGLNPGLPMLNVILPVGISFYTFQTLSYTIDVYRGRVSAESDLLDFALYVAFFPQLVAGPIERARHFLPQIKRRRVVRGADIGVGLQFVVVGYFAKVVIADSVAPIVDQVFADPGRYRPGIVWSAVLGFTIQIYGDFLGYSLIARGISRWFGFRLISNFRQPYLASSPRDFWRRWHRSLSFWLRRYLYFELGGSRGGVSKTCRNLMTVMLLGGLWHGAGWNFVLWGGYHGVLLVIDHAVADRGSSAGMIGVRRDRSAMFTRAMGTAVTFCLVVLGWVVFRCESVAQMTEVFRQLASAFWTNSPESSLPFDQQVVAAYALPVLAAAAVAFAFDIWRESASSQLVIVRSRPAVRTTLYAAMLCAIIAVGFRPAEFIYFQF